MKAEGNTGAYVAGTTGRPIPHIQTTGIRPAHASQEHKKESTFDWDAHTPTCTICGQKSGSVAEGVCSACRPVLVPTLSLVSDNTRHPQISASAPDQSTDTGPADQSEAPSAVEVFEPASAGELPSVPRAEAEPQPINWATQIHGIRAQLQRPTSAQSIGDAFRILADAACTLAYYFDQLEEQADKPTEGGVSRLSPSVEPTGPGTGKGKPTRVQSATTRKPRRSPTRVIPQEILDDYTAGMTAPVIARKHNTTPKRIRAIIDTAGIPKVDGRKLGSGSKPRVYSQAIKDAAIQAYLDGMTMVDVGRQLKIRPAVISTFLTEAGIQRRPSATENSANGIGTMHKLTRDQVTEIIRRNQAGENTAVLAKEFGVSRQNISHHIKRHTNQEGHN